MKPLIKVCWMKVSLMDFANFHYDSFSTDIWLLTSFSKQKIRRLAEIYSTITASVDLFCFSCLISVVELNFEENIYEGRNFKTGLLKCGSHPPHCLNQTPGIICKGICKERESIQWKSIIHTFQLAVKLAAIFTEWSLFPQSRKCIMDGKMKLLFNTHNSPMKECLYVDKVFKVFVETADETTPNYS